MPSFFYFFQGFLPSFFYPVTLCFLILVTGCKDEQQAAPNTSALKTSEAGCESCHQVKLDKNHQLTCNKCHRGDSKAKELDSAHRDLAITPAHPDTMEEFCGTCHDKEISMVANNPHYTLEGHLGVIREAFGAPPGPQSIEQLSSYNTPETPLQLADDLLTRRCLRCHLYTKGDIFPQTTRAIGCGACHLQMQEGVLVSHEFQRSPRDEQCLSCHYGNHVGADYYGRFEHDFNEEYRTPYTTYEPFFRPYGVEFHQLEPDVHQKAGMMCIDCHDQQEVMGSDDTAARCISCHDLLSLQQGDNKKISFVNNQYRINLTTHNRQLSLNLPVMRNPAHEKYKATVSCHACHARWSFGDAQTHLLRIDHDDLEIFDRLSLDGSSEVNTIILSHLDYEGEWLDPVMTNKFTNSVYEGIWLKGFSERRWEQIKLQRDDNGVLQVSRPIVDLYLSWIDADETVRFDTITPLPLIPKNRVYAPHTIGPAGPFYELRLRDNLQKIPPTSPQEIE